MIRSRKHFKCKCFKSRVGRARRKLRESVGRIEAREHASRYVA